MVKNVFIEANKLSTTMNYFENRFQQGDLYGCSFASSYTEDNPYNDQGFASYGNRNAEQGELQQNKPLFDPVIGGASYRALHEKKKNEREMTSFEKLQQEYDFIVR